MTEDSCIKLTENSLETHDHDDFLSFNLSPNMFWSFPLLLWVGGIQQNKFYHHIKEVNSVSIPKQGSQKDLK